MSKIVKLIISLGVSFAAGAIGSFATFSNIPTWYAQLAKAPFNPPNWVFGPVWTLLYVLMGISLYLIWTTPIKGDKRKAYVAFGVQLVLNTLWSLVFFGLHMPAGGLIVIIGLLASILLCIGLFWRINKSAALLLLPYAAWVSFATLLNASVMVLN